MPSFYRMYQCVLLCSLFLGGCAVQDKGEIIILLGTSTSGKSTLLKKVREINPGLDDCGLDLLLMREIAHEMKEKYPEHYSNLRQIISHDTIGNVIEGDNFRIQCADVSDKRKKRALKSAKHMRDAERKYQHETTVARQRQESLTRYYRILDDISQKLVSGAKIILDTQSSKIIEDLKKKRLNITLKHGIIFCSLKMLSQRITRRNALAYQMGEISNFRVGSPLWQYAMLYKPREKETEPILETLSREDAENAFETHFKVPLKKDIEASILENLHAQKLDKKTFLHVLGFTSPAIQRVEITPRYPYYSFIIDTTKEEGRSAYDATKTVLQQIGHAQ
jgi:ABC-type iron transport system FetAB ATPase subunit